MNEQIAGGEARRHSPASQRDETRPDGHTEDGQKWRGAAWWLVLPVLTAIAALALPYFALDFHRRYLVPEGYGGLEMAHFLIPLATVAYTFRVMATPAVRADRLVVALLVLFALGNIYIAGEEQSWGQHIFYWSTPEAWIELNRQQETNLHNMSGWLNQKPRAMLELGIFALACVALLRPGSAVRRCLRRVEPLIPTHHFVPIAAITTLMKFTAEGDIVERNIAAFAGARMSEIHELFLVLSLLYYIIIVGRKLRSRNAG